MESYFSAEKGHIFVSVETAKSDKNKSDSLSRNFPLVHLAATLHLHCVDCRVNHTYISRGNMPFSLFIK